MRKYSPAMAGFEGFGMRLSQLLEQEGQPCSYCIAVFLMLENGEVLAQDDNLAYRHHLLMAHGVKPYAVEP